MPYPLRKGNRNVSLTKNGTDGFPSRLNSHAVTAAKWGL